MALRALSSPNKDESGMHTPARNTNTDSEENEILNSMQKRNTSTALRPKAANLATICLDDTALSEISPDTPRRPGVLELEEVRPPRASSVWLEDMISGVESLAQKLRQERESLEASTSRGLSADFSSLGILSQTAMANSFDGIAGPNESYNALMKYRQRINMLRPSSTDSDNEAEEVASDGSDGTLLASDGSCNFSGLDVGAGQFSFSGANPEFGFDSNDFVSGDSSAVKRKMEKNPSTDRNDAIPSPHRIDLNEFSGFMGEGEIDIRPSWVSPEKRPTAATRRLTIGQYFSLKSSNIKELSRSLNSDRESLGMSSPPKSAKKQSPLPTGPRPELVMKIKSKKHNRAIDATLIGEEKGRVDETVRLDNTVRLDDTVRLDETASTDDSVQCLDMTMVPGRDSIMSRSAIDSLLNNTKGSDTIVGELLEVVTRHKSSKPSNTKQDVLKTPPSKSSTRRETFLVSPSQASPPPSNSSTSRETFLINPSQASPSTPTKFPSRIKEHKVIHHKSKLASPTVPKKRSPGRNNSYKSPYSKQSCSPARPVVKNALLEKVKGSPHKKALIRTPLKIEGPQQGVADLQMALSVTVTNVSSAPVRCTLVNTLQSRHLEVKMDSPVNVEPGASASLSAAVTALISGEHVVKLEVQVSQLNSPSNTQTHPVALHKLNFEAPKVTIVKQYQDFIDFGLRPEDSRKVSIVTVKNLGVCSVPVCLSVQQGAESSNFLLLVPPEGDDKDLQLAASLFFELPGTGQSEEPCVQDVGLVFIAPSLDNMRANLHDLEIVTLEGKLCVTLERVDDPRDDPHGPRVLDHCKLRGEVGRTQLLVSHTELFLRGGVPQSLGVRNGGVVPLDLALQGVGEQDQVEPGVVVQPSSLLLLPGEETMVSVMWSPRQGQTAPLYRVLHLMYDGNAEDNIVNLKCLPYNAQQSSERHSTGSVPGGARSQLPLRSTRLQLAWGSVSSGLTALQMVSYKNTGSRPLHLNVSIQSSDHSQEPPFKLLSDSKEVTHSLDLQFRAGQERRLSVMFSPQRPGPASASLVITPHDQEFATKQVPLTGYGGFSNVVLRRVATGQGRSWLTMQPSFEDFVNGNFTVANQGTLPALVRISHAPTAGCGCSLVVRPELLVLAPRASETVSVRLSGVKGILSEAHNGEVKTLTSLKVTWINEVSRRRLRRLLPRLSASDRASVLRLEQVVIAQGLSEVRVEGEEGLVAEAEISPLRDYSGASAASISRDLGCTEVELRAMGTGANHTTTVEEDTVSPFLSLMDTVIFKANTSMMETCQSVTSRLEWSVAPQEVTLHSGNSFRSTVQVCNLSASVRLCLDVKTLEGLSVSPATVEVLPCDTVTLELWLTRPPLHPAFWPAAVKVYSKNDVIDVTVKVLSPSSGHSTRTARNKSLGNTLSALRAVGLTPRQEWLTPSKGGATPASKPSVPKSFLTGCSSSCGSSVSSRRSSSSVPGVYFNTQALKFLWTSIGNTSSLPVTLYNESNFDKKVQVSSVPPEFSVEPSEFHVAGHWHRDITVKFSPLVTGERTEVLRLKVEGQPNLISVALLGKGVL